MYTIGHHNSVYPGMMKVTAMFTNGHHKSVYPGYIRYEGHPIKNETFSITD